MSHAPECLKERFKAADELVQELNESKCINENCSIEEPGVKLMCQLWNILKDNPNLNLTEAVKEQTKKLQKHNLSIPLNVTNLNLACLSAGSSDTITEVCSCSSDTNSNSTPCCSHKVPREPPGPDAPPLTKAIYNINEAASIGKKCGEEIKTLMSIQQELENEVKTLEEKDREVVETLKQTECMWMCMEEAYKKKIDEALAKQEKLMKELKEAEASKAKWKKNLKDLELEVNNVDNCHKEMQEKTKQKTNDLKSVETEVKNLNKHIADTKKDLESTKKMADNKKKSSDKKLTSMAAELKKLEKTLEDERKKKRDKELEGNRSLKVARDELQDLTKVLMKKKLENGDLAQEKQILVGELELLKQMASDCFNKRSDRVKSIDDEIARVDEEIAEIRTKSKKRHECTHTLDIKAYCMECPRCILDCPMDSCSSDKLDCVCMYVKEKFMSNVLENICTVLKKHSQTESGIAIAESVINSLKQSRTGKLDSEIKRKLQDFIISAMKKNINDSIVDGAVKTRCELDDKTYYQLMRCLKEIQVELLPVSDVDNKKSKTKEHSSNADNEVVLWKTEPCDGGSCKTVSSVRAVQCGLGPEVLTRDSITQPRGCDDCHVYSNVSSEPTAILSSSYKDVRKSKTSITNKNETVGEIPSSTKKLTTCCSDFKAKNIENKSLQSLKNQSPEYLNIDSFFVIKKTNDGHYEMILNKEFENVIKKNLIEHKFDWNSSEEYLFKFKESSSGHRIIEIEPKDNHNKDERDAIIIRTSSGTLRLFSIDTHLDYQRMHPKGNYTIVTKEDFMNLLLKFQTMVNNDTKTKSIQTSMCWFKKSRSDSSVYQTTMLNLNNEQCYMEIHEIIKRTKSGNYVITVNKISCKNDKPAKKNYVQIPITYNKSVTLKHRIKVSACKCAHIIVNKNEIDEIIPKNSKFTTKYDSKENIHICRGAQSEHSIPTSKSRSKDSNIDSNCQEEKKLSEKSSYKDCCQKCSIGNPEKDNQKCGTKFTDDSCALILKKILENPVECSTKECLRCDCTDPDDECYCNCNTKNSKDHERQRRNFLLRSLENLPPQLPMFLKEFNLEMA
ncbi:reticulocyte-binding protein 2-like isoform X2 [Aricia agestis]|uniref:reticulocyte-binding protein 2-like isoform X2 n=1 Tax=Aricia agestis TaxID=91739 RepID=UPI001C2046F3|nr:reticulocyte-binding protein 2-like isoform X2 [Aricia agestis]